MKYAPANTLRGPVVQRSSRPSNPPNKMKHPIKTNTRPRIAPSTLTIKTVSFGSGAVILPQDAWMAGFGQKRTSALRVVSDYV